MGQRIFLTGLRASGKTALGRALAVAVDGDWRDTDEEAEHLLGMSIAANKIKGIRAAVCSDEFSAKYTRLHNDANILCMGARVIGPGLAVELADIFLHTGFEGGRHQRRVDKITALES